uniref:hypothetical protein n=1 Tax=Altererythrobacter segetis TaxID=1104773 RepID=UPI00140E1476|nr:hypothetical protein [Altererythrobacter segetis]
MIRRGERWLGALGALGAVAALLLVLAGPREALTGWLGAVSFIAGLPAGGLILLLMMPLISGKWTEDLRGPARLLGALWPLAALVFVPVVIGMAAIYPWFGAPPHSAFAGVWLNPPFFAARTVGWFALAGLIAARAAAPMSEGVAAGLLIAVVLADNFVATDWLMTLDPKFASSAFGAQVIVFDVCAGLAAMILLRLAAGKPRHTGVLGGLLLTLLLLWAYFQFMPFLIVWSGNLPDGVGWYLARRGSGWVAAIVAASVLGGVPMFALLAPQARRSPRGLGLCAAAVLAGKAIEFAWLALPGRSGLAVLAWLLALAGLGCLAVASLLRAARLAEAAA